MVQMNEDVKNKAESVYSEGKQEVESLTEKAKSGTRQRVVPFLSDRKDQLVQQLNQTAGALRDSGDQIENSRGQNLIRLSAQKIEQLGGYLGTRDIEEIIDDLKNYARARPWAFMGGAFVVGLAAARFIKAGGGRSTTVGPGAAERLR